MSVSPQANSDEDPYPITPINPGPLRKGLTIVLRAFSTSLDGHKVTQSEVDAFESKPYGGLAIRFLCWRESVMVMGALFLCYSLGHDAVDKVLAIVARKHHASSGDLYRKIFHTQILIENISDSVYAISLLVALGFWLYALYTWKNYHKSARALRIGYVISFCIPFMLMLTFPYRKGIDIPSLAADSCHSVVNGRIPDILSQIKHSGNHKTVYGAKKAARKKNKPDVKARFSKMIASHIPHVNLTSMFHRMHIEVPETICDFKDPKWSANIKQTLINAGFVRDQTTNTCPAAIQAMKAMHLVPKNFNPSPKFRHLLSVNGDEDSEVFSLDTNKKFTKKQCKPCEACVDPECRQHAIHLLGKHFSLSPVLKKSLHLVRHAKEAVHEFKKKHEKQIKAAEHKIDMQLHHMGSKFEKQMIQKHPIFGKVIAEGKKTLKKFGVAGLLHLRSYERKLKKEYHKFEVEQHKYMLKLQKQGAAKIKQARAHGKHHYKEVKKKYAKKFAHAKKHMAKKLKSAHKKMVWKIRKSKAKYLAKIASIGAKVAAARHARLAKAKGGEKVLLKYKNRLFAKLKTLQTKYQAKFEARKNKIKAVLKKKKQKFSKRLKATHSSKSYVAKLKSYVHKINKAKKKALDQIRKSEAKMLKRMDHAKKSSLFYATKEDVHKLLKHIKKHVNLNLGHVKHEVLRKMSKFTHSGAHVFNAMLKKSKAVYKKAYAHHQAKFQTLKSHAWAKFIKLKKDQKSLVEKFKKELKGGLKKAKKSGSSIYKKAKAEAKAKLAIIKKDAAVANQKARDAMRNTIDKHHKEFVKASKAVKARYHSIKKKMKSKQGYMHLIEKHTKAFKARYETNKEKYKHSYKALKAKLHQEEKLLKKTGTDKLMKTALQASKKRITAAKKAMKVKIAKGKALYKAHKAQLKHEVHQMIAKARKLASKLTHNKGKIPSVRKETAPKTGRRLLTEVDDEDFLAAEEMESDEEMTSHEGHKKTPAKCAKCHAACYKNCALQYFGPAILKNTISSTMCMGSKNLNALDTIKTAMDAVGHIDYVLGGQQGLMAFGLLLPASLSFLSAVLKATKLVKKVLPQSRLAGYLIVLAAMSNLPILSAFIAMAYQAVGDVYFCLGCLSFLSTFLVFCVRTESLVKSQTHEQASNHIDGRAKLTLVGFGFAGIFLGVYVWEHQVIVRAALHLPLTMLIIKKVCDYLGRTMFTLVVMVDLIFALFNMLYGGPNGDRLEDQEFSVPLGQLKMLFVDEGVINKIEEEETEARA